MRKTSFTLGAVIAAALAIALTAQTSPQQDSGSHLGTWRLVSVKYDDATTFSRYPGAQQRLKMITATHFTWVEYDTQTKKIVSSAGGSYSLRESAYIESIDFAGAGMEEYLGKKQEFRIKIEGDALHLSGQLSDGYKIEEVWERLKPEGTR